MFSIREQKQSQSFYLDPVNRCKKWSNNFFGDKLVMVSSSLALNLRANCFKHPVSLYWHGLVKRSLSCLWIKL